MVDVIGRAKVIISGDVDSTSIDTAGGKIGSSLKRGAVIGVAALGTLAVAGVKAFQAFEEAEAVSRKLTNVLDNMGKGGAAPALEELADSLQRVTGIDDEVIKGGQTILATFSDVAESAGELGGTFDRAIRIAVDMSSVFGSVESASRVLGKALSDPEKAAALLRRSNVILNESQQELIDNFLAAGDAAGAQDVILQALEDRYKGTAEAGATETEKIARGWDEVKESVGLALSELTGGEVESFSEALFAMADSIEDLAESEGWQATGDALAELNKDVKDDTTFLGMWADQTKDNAKSLGTFATAVENSASRTKAAWKGIPGLFKSWGQSIEDTLDSLIDNIKEYIDWQRQVDDSPITGDDVPDAPDSSQPRSTRAGGGPVRGLALVGENGPELAQFGDSGGYVYNNSQTRDILSDAASGGDTINYWQFYGPESLSQARRDAEWANTYGTRFGSAATAGAR